jgi:hypothetical protein
MQDAYTIRYDPTWPEFYYFSLVTLFYMKFIRGLVMLVAICALLSSLFGMLTSSVHQKAGMPALLQVLLTVVALPLTFAILALVLTIPLYVMRPEIVRGHTYRFSAAGQFMIPWSAFSRIRESRSFFLLFVQQTNGQQIHFVQKRMFADEDSARAFRAFVELQLQH